MNISLYSKVSVQIDLMIAGRQQIKLNKQVAGGGLSVSRGAGLLPKDLCIVIGKEKQEWKRSWFYEEIERGSMIS